MLWWMSSFAWAQSATTVYDESFSGSISEEVMAVLGPRDNLNLTPSAGRINLGIGLEAEFGAVVDCGAIKFEGDLQAALPDVSKLPEELAGAAQTFVAALPMLTICHTSPSLCAELKNLNLRIDEQWSFQADLCKAMDGYIDEQAQEGMVESQRRWMNRCIQKKKEEEDMSPSEAERVCAEADEPYLVGDIAQGFLDDAFSNGPQRIVEKALEATQTKLSKNPKFYEFLVAVGGEMELRHNGEVMPLFPENGSLQAEDLAKDIETSAKRLSCSSSLRFWVASVTDEGNYTPGEPPSNVDSFVHVNLASDDAARFWLDEMFNVLNHEFTLREYENLHTLDTRDSNMMCQRMGRVLAAEVVRRLDDMTDSEVAQMDLNPKLPKEGRRILKNIEKSVDLVRRNLEDESIPEIPAFRLELETAADVVRRRNRDTAGALSSGEERLQRALGDRPVCNSYRTCGGG